MIVTAQRMETKDLDTPAMTSVITAADIEKTGATTVMEALRDIVGITDYSYAGNGDDQGSSTSRILVRGFDKGSLVLLNGAPINIMNYGSASGIPVEAIEKIEVVKGANSVLYGAEALGGVINIITKKGEGKQKVGISGTIGNYQRKWSSNIQGDGYFVSIGKDYIDEFSPAQKPNKKNRTYRVCEEYQRENVFTSLMISPNLQFNFIHSEMDPAYFNRNLTDGTMKSGSRYTYEDKRNLASLVYNDEENKLKTILSYNDKKIESSSTYATSNYEASNIFFDTQKQWDIGDKDTLIAGISVKREEYNEIDYNHKDNDRDSYGIYVSWNKKFNDKFSTTIGVRGQHYSSTEFDQNYDEFMPQFQAVYKLSENVSWFANVAEAFELPAVNAHATDSKAAIGFISNYPVKPQTGWNYETGIKKVTDTTSTKLAVYHMDYKNKFAWKLADELGLQGLPDGSKIQVNLGKFENTGIEFDYKKVLGDRWSYNLGASYQTPESYDEGKKEWKQESARVQLTAGVDYQYNKFNANMNVLYLGDREDSYYRYDGGKASDSRPDHKLRDRVKLNACLSYNPTKNQSVSFNMYNLLDRDDVVYSYEYYDLPFNWTLTYTHTF